MLIGQGIVHAAPSVLAELVQLAGEQLLRV